MTPEQAKNKWCPFARSVALLGKGKLGPAANRCHDRNGTGEGDVQPYASCLGEECMAWRQLEAQPGGPSTAGQGYCGLAGKP